MTDVLRLLAPDPIAVVIGVVADLAIGDPVYRWHPVRLIGRTLTWLETRLRALGFDGYGGGIALFVGLAATSIGTLVAILAATGAVAWWLASLVHIFLLYSLLALGDLLRHVRRIERAVAGDDLVAARRAVSQLVGRDTDPMDGPACRRAAVESLSENFTDGFVSSLFWYVAAGLPGLVLFKVVSTMDSMIGYKSPRYLRFGWCGARLDDVMNYLPARLTWLVIVVVGWFIPACSARKAWDVGLQQHHLLLGPNSGWSEAGAAGALQRRIVGPIWLNGVLVTDLWIGDASDPPLATGDDVTRAMRLVLIGGLLVITSAVIVILIATSLNPLSSSSIN